MHRHWFKVYHQRQPLDPPLLVVDLPRRTHLAGHVVTRHGRDGVLTEVFILAADAAQAWQLFEEARAHLFAE